MSALQVEVQMGRVESAIDIVFESVSRVCRAGPSKGPIDRRYAIHISTTGKAVAELEIARGCYVSGEAN